MINVTKPNLPEFGKYVEYLKGIWDRNWLTNNGPLVNELELRLKEYLQANHVFFLTNGTIALQIAIKALGVTGEVITTPFSYVATTSSIVWESCQPVFVDIEPYGFTLDPDLVERAITDKTTAIIATHVFGNPCQIDKIQKIADHHKLKIIYDGAHSFGSKYKGKPVNNFGDLTTFSFHSTKLFHSIEGGAIATNDPAIAKQVFHMRNFGHNGREEYFNLGINGKNSEFHAAMGLCNLDNIDSILEARKKMSLYYDKKLKDLRVQHIKHTSNADFNYAYYPIVLKSEEALLEAVNELALSLVTPRRYFYPSLNLLPYIDNQPMPVSEDISKRILCLPLYYEISEVEIDMICRGLLRAQSYPKSIDDIPMNIL